MQSKPDQRILDYKQVSDRQLIHQLKLCFSGGSWNARFAQRLAKVLMPCRFSFTFFRTFNA